MYRVTTTLVLLISLFFVGCAGMSKKDCTTADWYTMGLQDGRAGYASSRMSNYVASCAEHDIRIDQAQYLSGHDEGVRYYCQPENGYQVGLRGRSLPTVCPADLAAAFEDAHAQGYREFKIKRDISNAQQNLSRFERDRTNIEQERIDVTAQLYALENADDKSAAQQNLNAVNDRLQSVNNQFVTAIGDLACATGDWYQAGISDGEAGRSASTYRSHLRQCQDYHPKPDQKAYMSGQSAGLQNYCRFDNGVRIGERGLSMSTLCQGANKRELERGYAIGLETYNAKVTLAGLQIRQADLKKRQPLLVTEQLRLEQELTKPDLTSAQKLTLTRELNRVKMERSQVELNLQTTQDEMNCYVGDWQVFGFESAERGDVFTDPSLNCQRYGVTADTAKYRTGYELGLANYCTVANGAAIGSKGLEYNGICPRAVEADFLDGYLPAFREFQRQALKQQLTIDVEQSNKLLTNLRTDIDVLSNDLEQPGLTRSEKLAIINEVASLSEREKKLMVENEKLTSHWQCLTDNWLELGKQHGAQGLGSRLKVLNCERFEITPKTTDYRNGVSRGLTSWCTYQRGYEMATAGELATTSCLKTTHREYYRGYREAEQEQQRQAQVNQLKVEKLDIIERLPVAKQRIAEIDSMLAAGNLSSTTTRRLKQEKLTLQKSILDDETRLEQIENELALLGA